MERAQRVASEASLRHQGPLALAQPARRPLCVDGGASLSLPLPRRVVVVHGGFALASAVALLRARGVAVSECGDAAEAVGLAGASRADALLIDLATAGWDPDDIQRRLLRARIGAAPVLVASAAQRCRRMGGVPILRPPVRAADLLAALALARAQADHAHGLLALAEDEARPLGSAGPPAIVVRERGRVRLLAAADIEWIDAMRNAVRIHAGGGALRHPRSIGALQQQLAGRRFLRIHRSTLVNLDAVVEFEVNARGSYTALMRGGIRLAVGPAYRRSLLDLWRGGAAP